MNDEVAPLEIRTYFVRGRNALLARADFSNLYLEYYLQLADTGQRFDPAIDQKFKETIAALCLHASSRPWNEIIAWTLHYENPACNIFVTADNTAGNTVGTLFTENVQKKGTNLFFSDVISGDQPSRRSVVEMPDETPFETATRFYQHSEQRLVRYFAFTDEDYVLVSAEPDCDLEWLAALTEADIRNLDKTEVLALLEKRPFQWKCGCSQEKMENLLLPTMSKDPDALFGNEETLTMRCPRCGTRHTLTRKQMVEKLKTAFGESNS